MDTNISLDGSSSDPKTAIMNQVKQEAAMNNARQIIGKLNQHCFEKCIPTPGTSLSKKEDQCFTMCMEKYMMTWNAVSRAYIQRIPKQSTSGETLLM